MQTFTHESIDNMNIDELRYMLKMQLERNELLVKQNEFVMFRYECLTGDMHLLMAKPDGQLIRPLFHNYFENIPDLIFDAKEHKRVVDTIKRIISDPKTPRTGAVAFTYKDGRRMSCEYTRLDDENGNAIAVVGQHIDMYKTHQRMVTTIDILNEKQLIYDKMMNTYDTIIMFDLSDHSFQVMRGTQAVRALSGQVESYMQLAQEFRDFYIEDDFHTVFDDFINPDTILERLKGVRSISCTYKTTNIGWCHARIVPIVHDAAGEVKKLVMTTEPIENTDARTTNKENNISLDVLTNLLNRASGKEIVDKSLLLPHEGLFMLFDIDFFAAINNMLGIPVGDMLLIEVSKVLSALFPHDVVMRECGDAFVVYATSPATLNMLHEQGHEAIFKMVTDGIEHIHIPEMNGITSTVSAGMVYCEAQCGATFDMCLTAAMQSLYEVKEIGPSQVCLHKCSNETEK